MSIHARRTAQGARYDVRLRTPDGQQYKRTFRTRKEAETFYAVEVADRSRGGWIDPRRSAVTFGEWAAEWFASDPGKRPSTLARDETILRLHLLPVFGRRPLGSLTQPEIQKIVSAWDRKLAPRTVRRQYDVLRAVMAAAVDADLLMRSPCPGGSSCPPPKAYVATS